jgi:hypothetical protein
MPPVGAGPKVSCDPGARRNPRIQPKVQDRCPPSLGSQRQNLLIHEVEQDLEAELRAAFNLLVDETIRAGMPSEDAHRAAAIELGGIEIVKQHVREARSGAFVEALLQDIRYAARTLRASPLSTLIAVLSLGIGIAGTSVIFGLISSWLTAAFLTSLPEETKVRRRPC